ncbi:MAG: DUF3408 domain-containing protein [Bacteroidales bacterium]
MSETEKELISEEDAMFVIHSAKDKERRDNLLPPRPVYPPSMQREMAEKAAEEERKRLEAETGTSNESPSIKPQEDVTQEETNQAKAIEQNKEVKPKENVKKRKKDFDYGAVFLTKSSSQARDSKMVNIQQKYHAWLMRIVQATKDKDVTLFSYLDKILSHHFRTFENEILETHAKNQEKDGFMRFDDK